MYAASITKPYICVEDKRCAPPYLDALAQKKNGGDI